MNTIRDVDFCELEDFFPDAFYDIITGAPIEDAVIAEDDRSYSRKSITEWFQYRDNNSLEIISPLTREPIGRSLRDNIELRLAIDQYKNVLEKKKKYRIEKMRVGDEVPQQQIIVRSVRDLGLIFTQLDLLRPILNQALKGWNPPQIVVLGAESSGKSTILERLALMSIFPRADNICTRIPIHVRLRRTEKPQAPRLVVWNKLTCAIEQTITMIPTDSGHIYVRAHYL